MPAFLKRFIRKEEGLGTVEVVIIIAVLVGIALIFREAIVDFVKKVLSLIFNDGIRDQFDPQNM